MKAIKKLVLVSVVAGFVLGLASCNKHTCPTYSHVENNSTVTKA